MAKEFLKKHFIDDVKGSLYKVVVGSGGTTPGQDTVEIDILPERELIFWGGGDDIWTNSAESMFTLEEGQTYHVSIDGVVHSCVAKKTVDEYDDGSGYDSYVRLGWDYDDDGNTVYSHPFCIETCTEVYEGTAYAYWYVGLQGDHVPDEPLPHTIRIYRECKAEELVSISTEFSIPTKNHNNGMILYEEPLRLDIGWTYTVSVMGQTCECRCGIEPNRGMLYLGNPLLAGATPNEGDDQYPFFMANIEQDGTRAIGVMIDPSTFPIGEDIHVTCHFKDIGEVRLENANIFENGVYYPSEGYAGFASVKVTASGASGPGLYAVYDTREEQIMDWDGLIDGGYFNVMSGSLSNGGSYLSDIIPTSESCTTVLRLPDDGTITTIAGYAFQNARGLTTIDFGKNCSVLAIAQNAFSKVNGIYDINIPTSVGVIDSYAFENNTTTQKIVFEDNSQLQSLATYAFSSYGGLRYLDFGNFNSLSSIGDYACYCCSNLETVDFGNYSALETIGAQAFCECSKLNGVNFGIGSRLHTIGSSAFWGCTSLTRMTIPDSVMTLANGVFGNCTSLTRMTIPDSVTTFGEKIFSGCSALTYARLPYGISTIPEQTFNGCTSLTSIGPAGSGADVEIPNGVTMIDTSAFAGCTGLTSIKSPETVTSYGDNVFNGCTSLTSIGPAGSGADVELSTKMTGTGYEMFRNCTSLVTVEFPANIKTIAKYTFSGCTGLVNIEFPETITRIRDDAFNGCTGLTKITIHGSATRIDNRVFQGCINLSIVTVLAETPPTCNSSSFTADYISEIRVPASSVDAYKAADGWSTYASKIVAIA